MTKSHYCIFEPLRLITIGFGASLLLAMAAQAEPGYDATMSSGPSARIGGMMVVKPKYEGSDEHEVIGVPFIIPNFSAANPDSGLAQFGRRVSFKSIDDIRFRALNWSNIEFGPVAGYRSGRDESDGDRLGGLGDIDDGLVVGGYAGFRIGKLLLDVSAATQVTGDDSGVLVRAGAEVAHNLSNHLRVTTRVGATFADDDYAETFFGITPQQAARSTAGLAAYDAGAGLKDIHVDLGAQLNLSDSWRLQLGGRYARLIGDAGDSPIVESKDQFTGRLGLTYRLDFSPWH